MFDSASYQAFSDALNALRPGWAVNDNQVVGPDGAVVRLAQRHHSPSLGHYDVEFILDARASRPVDIWDCVGGFGSTEAERAGFAARLWSLTTAATVLELKYSGRGEFADHYRGSEPDGFTEWHAIAGAIIGFGAEASATALQQWWVANPPLPSIARALVDSLIDDGPYGLKSLFGGEGVGEVRVNGEAHEGASSCGRGVAVASTATAGLCAILRDPRASRSHVVNSGAAGLWHQPSNHGPWPVHRRSSSRPIVSEAAN